MQRQRTTRNTRLVFLPLAGLALSLVLGLLVAQLVDPAPLLPARSALPQGATVATRDLGRLLFLSSGQLDPTSKSGINDTVQLDLHGLPLPAAGNSYYAWLLADSPAEEEIAPVLLGKFNIGTAHLVFRDGQHHNLLARYSRFLLTLQPSSPLPLVPAPNTAMWRATGAIPNIPAPLDAHHYSLLSHLRHLLASDPTIAAIGLAGGLDIWLYRNASKVLEWATSARDDWAGGQAAVALLRRQVIRILDQLDGAVAIVQDVPAETPFLVDQRTGRIGLLDLSPTQIPPGYVSHVALHLTGLMKAPGALPDQQQLAESILAALSRAGARLERVREDARQLLQGDDATLLSQRSLGLLDEMQSEASQAFAGTVDPATGIPAGGIAWLHGQLQRLAVLSIGSYQPGSRH